LTAGGKTYRSRSSPRTASRAAHARRSRLRADLGDKVDLLLAQAAPDTTNPVADQPKSTKCPASPQTVHAALFLRPQGRPKKGFTWTYHFFWGLEDVIGSFLALWTRCDQQGRRRLFPNDADGNAWGDKERGLPPALTAAGYKLFDPGRYQVMNNDFTSQISAFKARARDRHRQHDPPDFATFWSQAAQQGFKPKIVTIGKALLFPSVIESLASAATA